MNPIAPRPAHDGDYPFEGAEGNPGDPSGPDWLEGVLAVQARAEAFADWLDGE